MVRAKKKSTQRRTLIAAALGWMLDAFDVTVKHEQARLIPPLGRSRSDQLARQMIVEQINAHKRLSHRR